jgi:hypothetical protein
MERGSTIRALAVLVLIAIAAGGAFLFYLYGGSIEDERSPTGEPSSEAERRVGRPALLHDSSTETASPTTTPDVSAEEPQKKSEGEPARNTATEPIELADSREFPTAFQSHLEEIDQLREKGRFAEALEAILALQQQVSSAKRSYQLNQLLKDVRKERYEAAGIPRLTDQLGAKDDTVRRMARQKLMRKGEVKLPFLRSVVRKGSGTAAGEAISILLQENDPVIPPILMERFLRSAAAERPPAEKDPAQVFLQGFWKYVETLPQERKDILAEPLLRFYQTHWNGLDSRGKRTHARLFLFPLAQWFDGEEEPFETWLGSDKAYDQLEALIETSFRSDDEAARAFAEGHLRLFDIARPGWRGQYYTGTGLETLVFQRLDTKLNWPRGAFGYPDNRGTNISIRWSGRIRIPEDGEYTFYSTSDDGQRLYVDGKPVIDDWNHHGMQTRSATLTLAAGTYRIKQEFFQGGGGKGLIVQWKGPGFDRQLLTAEHVFTTPWPGIGTASEGG